MKKVIFIVFSLLISFFTSAQTPKELFEEANNWYKKGNYSKAADLYSKIENKGFVSEDVYYNLGNCYYKLNKIAPSIYNYEKALKLNPIHTDAKNNLAFANRMKIDVIETLPKTFWQKASDVIIKKLNFDTWAILAIVFSFLGTLLFLSYYFSTSSTKKLLFFNVSIIAFIAFLITTFFAYTNYHTTTSNKEGIIFKQKVEVKNAPSGKSDTDFELHEGTKVYLIDNVDHWQKIKLANGKIGWIKTTSLKEI